MCGLHLSKAVVVVVIVVTRHGGVATFAEAVFKLQPQDTATDRNVPG